MASEADRAASNTMTPLSEGQRALWFLQQLNPGSAAYNIARATTIRGDLDPSTFKASWQRLMDRHAVLRSTFLSRDGQPMRVVHDQMAVEYEALDAVGWAEDAVTDHLSREVSRPFDLERGPLMRVKVLKRSREENSCLVVWHHTITDLWSLGILLSELDVIYRAEIQGEAPPLRPVKASYSDFVQEQAAMLASAEGESLWAYWRDQLADAPQVLEMPTDRRRPPLQSWQGASVVRRLPAELVRRLEALASSSGTTLHALSLAAFAALVHRYTGQEEFLIGAPRAGRTRRYFFTVGYFVNPIVIRVDAAGDPPFHEFLQRVGRTMLEAREHQKYPFIRIVEQLQRRRDLSRSPLYQVSFAWQKGSAQGPQGLSSFALHESGGAMKLGGLEWEFLNLEQQVVPLDLNMLMVEDGDEVAVCAEYATALFDRPTVERLLGHLCTLFEAIVEDPAVCLSTLPLMSQCERDRVLLDWSGTPSQEQPARLVHESFESMAVEHADKPAVILGDERLTYSELNRRSNQLARHLRDLGVGANTAVALNVHRSVEMVVGLLGILKSGGAYLPVDPAYPRDRNGLVLGDADPAVLVTISGLESTLPSHSAPVVRLDGDSDLMAEHDDSDLGMHIDREAPAYIIYTSGSTGQPKGIAISHETLANHRRDVGAFFGIGPQDRVLQFASLCFDASVEQILTALCAGATLLPRGEELWQAAQFHEWVAENDVTVVNVPPAYWHQWVEAYATAPDWRPLDHLRLVIVGGDVMRPETVRLWQSTPLNSVRLLNAYGPTEATVTATTYEVSGEHDAGRARVPIGRPLPGRRAYVLDRLGNPVPAGVPGELYLGGSGLAQRYVNRPDLTTQKFVPDPFSSDPGARLYRTGDRARFLGDGSLEHLGRIDLQVKVRGFRIEPEEVETILCQHSSVAEAAVSTIPEEEGDGRLVAYLVPEDEAELGHDDLRDHLARRLPDYMVPSFYVLVDHLPLAPGGKVDRRALIEMEGSGLTLERPYVAPRNKIESEIAELWSEILGVEHVGVHDDFFELGGHSLLATQLVSRIRRSFQVEIPLQELFDVPTVEKLGLLITESLAVQEDAEALDDLLDELGELSDEEVKELLSDELGRTP